jgi:uracil-DNA glycosylase
MTIQTWDGLSYWQSDFWGTIQRRLDEYDSKGILYNPRRHLLFTALDQVPRDKVKAIMVGQDPYPVPSVATGQAFSVPKGSRIPATLANILTEYEHDLHYPRPKHGDLSCWGSQGVLMVNTFWSVGSEPLSHSWDEWRALTRAVLACCDDPSIPMVFMGGQARELTAEIHSSPMLCISHPSPRGSLNARSPFRGSRPFTWVNSRVVGGPIDWRIPDVYRI